MSLNRRFFTLGTAGALAAAGIARGTGAHEAHVHRAAAPLGDLTTTPLHDVQTIGVPPGGAAVVDLKLQVPGRFLLVDHALSRLEKGCVGFLQVEGAPDPGVFAA